MNREAWRSQKAAPYTQFNWRALLELNRAVTPPGKMVSMSGSGASTHLQHAERCERQRGVVSIPLQFSFKELHNTVFSIHECLVCGAHLKSHV